MQIPSEATSQGHNGYLTEDKLMSVINYLHSIKPQDVQNSIDQVLLDFLLGLVKFSK